MFLAKMNRTQKRLLLNFLFRGSAGFAVFDKFEVGLFDNVIASEFRCRQTAISNHSLDAPNTNAKFFSSFFGGEQLHKVILLS